MYTKVSVAMATYNGSRFILEQLESIRTQTRKVDEVVIMDDCSTDNTKYLVEEYIAKYKLKGWKFYINESNLGYARNFIKAIETTTGDVVFLCDQDDVWIKNKVESMVQLLEDNEQIWMLHSEINLIDEFDNIIDTKYQKLATGFKEIRFKRYIKRLNYCGMSSAFSYKLRDCIKELDLSDIPTHDWILGALAVTFGKFATIDIVFTNRRKHSNNAALVQKNSNPSKSERIDYIKKYNEFYGSLLRVLASGSNQDGITNELNQSININMRRITCLERSSIIGLLALLPCITHYPSTKAYFSDFRYLLR